MKKIIISAAIAAFALVSCNKSNNETVNTEPIIDGSEVVINFDKAGGQFDTRAFFDNTADAEPWEKEIKTASVYVCNPAGEVVMTKVFSRAEITQKEVTLYLQKEVAGVLCKFYVFVNPPFLLPQFYPRSESDVIKSFTSHTSLYNGVFAVVSTKSTSESGFPMTGMSEAIVQPKGTPTKVRVLARRSLAKVAIKTLIDPTFSANNNGGKIFVKSARLSNIPADVTIYPQSVTPTYKEGYYTEQQSSLVAGEYCNLFYMPDTPVLEDSKKVFLTINALFDQDGNSSLITDQIPVSWSVQLDGSGGGEIRRNGYYRLALNIKSINALDDIDAILQVSEWETPSSQSGELNETNQTN